MKLDEMLHSWWRDFDGLNRRPIYADPEFYLAKLAFLKNVVFSVKFEFRLGRMTLAVGAGVCYGYFFLFYISTYVFNVTLVEDGHTPAFGTYFVFRYLRQLVDLGLIFLLVDGIPVDFSSVSIGTICDYFWSIKALNCTAA